jgi:hypothetical protein
MRDYSIHGFELSSAFDVPCLPASPGAIAQSVSLRLEEASREINVIADLSDPSDPAAILYEDHQQRIIRTSTGLASDYPRSGVCFPLELAASQTIIRTRLSNANLGEWVNILAQGAVITAALRLMGHGSLHATTVDLDGTGLAIAGASGAGKTLVSSLLLLSGATLISDDVSVVQPNSRVYPGLLELRIRVADQLGRAVADRLVGETAAIARDTVDKRVALRPETLPGLTGCRLDAIVLPHIDESSAEVTLEPVTTNDTIMALLKSMRLVGWIDPSMLRADFEFCTNLAANYPVYRLRLPQVTAPKLELLRLQIVERLRHITS